MVVPQNNVRGCRNCGTIYSELSHRNPMKCPVCGHMEGEDVEGIHY